MKKILVMFLVGLLLVGCTKDIKKNEVYIIEDEKKSVDALDIDILVKNSSELLFTNQSYLYKQLKKYEEENDLNINYYYEYGNDNNIKEGSAKIDLIVSDYSDDWMYNIQWDNYFNNKDIVSGVPGYFENQYIVPFALRKPGYLLRKSQLNMIYEKESDYDNMSFQEIYDDWVRVYDIDMDLENEANTIIREVFPSINNYTYFDIEKTIGFIKDIKESVSESSIEAWILDTEKNEYGFSYEDLKHLLFDNINRSVDFYSQAIFDEMNPNILSGTMNNMYEGYGAFLVRDGDDLPLDVEGLLVPKDTDNLYQVKKVCEYLLNRENQLEFFKSIDGNIRYSYTPIYVDLYEEMNKIDESKGYNNIAIDARVKLKEKLEAGKVEFSKPFNRNAIIKIRKYHMTVFDFIKAGNYSSESYEKLEEDLKGIILP